MVDFKAKIKDVPDNPGVYMMLDEQGQIIYVGKAKNLKTGFVPIFSICPIARQKLWQCSNMWRIFDISSVQAKSTRY